MRTLATWGSRVRVAVSPGVALADSATGERRRRSGNPAWYRFNILGILSQGFAQNKDVIGKIALFDKRVGPKRSDKFLFLQQMAAVADQKHQGIKGLGCENYKFVVAR